MREQIQFLGIRLKVDNVSFWFIFKTRSVLKNVLSLEKQCSTLARATTWGLISSRFKPWLVAEKEGSFLYLIINCDHCQALTKY